MGHQIDPSLETRSLTKQSRCGQQPHCQQCQRGQQLRYEMVLVQGRNQSDRVRGRFSLQVEGVRDGEAETLQASNAEGETDMLFSFRHFQEFTGSMKMPEGFSPRQVRVRLQREGGDEPVDTSYEWQRVVAETEG